MDANPVQKQGHDITVQKDVYPPNRSAHVAVSLDELVAEYRLQRFTIMWTFHQALALVVGGQFAFVW